MSNQVIEEIRKAEADAEKVKLAAREKAAIPFTIFAMSVS